MNDMSKYESSLKIVDLYFSKFNFENKRILGTTRIKTSCNIQHFGDEDHNQVVVITMLITTENNSLNLSVELTGKFKLDNSHELSEELSKEILLKNTVAIMMPYIRSQISLLTTQPGIPPIMLPLIDVNQLLDDKDVVIDHYEAPKDNNTSK